MTKNSVSNVPALDRASKFTTETQGAHEGVSGVISAGDANGAGRQLCVKAARGTTPLVLVVGRRYDCVGSRSLHVARF